MPKALSTRRRPLCSTFAGRQGQALTLNVQYMVGLHMPLCLMYVNGQSSALGDVSAMNLCRRLLARPTGQSTITAVSHRGQACQCSAAKRSTAVTIAAGANHKLAENDLKPAKRIIKAQRKHKRNPAGRSQTQHPDSVMIDI